MKSVEGRRIDMLTSERLLKTRLSHNVSITSGVLVQMASVLDLSHGPWHNW